jgi:hypothetical protein
VLNRDHRRRIKTKAIVWIHALLFSFVSFLCQSNTMSKFYSALGSSVAGAGASAGAASFASVAASAGASVSDEVQRVWEY